MSDGTRDFDILVVGELNPDLVVSDDDPVPVFGEVERVVRSIHMTVGSSSAIFACGAARLGLRVAFVGIVGDDPFGRFMLDTLAARGIDVSACAVDPNLPTGATVILTSGRGRAMLTSMGTIGVLNMADVPDKLLDRARHLHVGAYFLQGGDRVGLPVLFARAHARGLTTSLDTNWDPPERWDDGIREMLQATDVFLPNALEARRIAGRDDVADAAAELVRIGGNGRSDGGPIVVVKQGSGGAFAVGPGLPLTRVRAMPIEPLDTTGAGDSFDAGFLRAWLDQTSLDEALRLGAACGALSTRSLGGVDGQATLIEAHAELDHGSVP
ncbi:MAG: carbohydrate kinase family protein [Chloroflexota bacterium]